MAGEKLLGKKIGPYTIEGIVGQGSMALIYRALNSDDKPLALKMLFPPAGVDDQEILTRFDRETRTAANLHHPHILPVLDSGHYDGRAYLVMPLIDGETLEERLRRKNTLDELTATSIGLQIAHALNYAHLEGIVHRDVKPSNVLLSKNDDAYLTDFGVARALDAPALTQAGHIVGTPAYMAPEQAIEEKPIDARTDLYSLGVMLYRMVTGRLPFRGSTPELLHAHVYKAPPAPSSVAKVSPQMEAIILRAMAKAPEDRYPDGATMAQALTRLEHQLINQAQNSKSWQTVVKGWVNSALRRSS